MSKLDIFESAMCCPTGVCGVSVDPVLVQFNADLQWLTEQGIEVARHSLNQDPAAFASQPAVLKEIEAGMDRLPIAMVNGHIVSTGMYPSRAQLVQKLGIGAGTPSSAGKPHIKLGDCGCKPGQC